MTIWSNVVFEVSSADPDADTPVWVDLTPYVRPTRQRIELNTGRQSELDQSEPSQLTLLLDNRDDRFTFGNTSSPYAAWWGPGRRCRLRETVGGHTLDLFTGYLEMPTETVVVEGKDQTVTVSAVDRLGRLEKTQTFVSTLAAHIVGSESVALSAYWPLLDQSLPFANAVGSNPLGTVVLTGSVNPLETQPSLEFANDPPLPGDDLSTLRMIPGVNGAGTAWAPILFSAVSGSGAPSLAAGQVMTAVMWVNLDLTYDDSITLFVIATSDGPITATRRAAVSGGDIRLTKPVGTLTGSVNSGIVVGSNRWYQIGVRFGYSTNVLELWVDDNVHVATLSGVLAGPVDIQVQVGPYILGSVAHLQLYIGADADWTNTDFVSQRAVGLTGLERQTTGERIRTIAQYAGIPGAELNRIDTGCSVMSRALLAGKTPLDAMREAEQTEQGLLHVDGTGNLVFADRRTLYNI